jgi:putative phage tail component, N-terminal domain
VDYGFRDTNPCVNSELSFLPAEAMNFNGTYIENLIEGYRTLSVSGRELIETEIISKQLGLSDGVYVSGTRLPHREIAVKYQLSAKDPRSFREKFVRLNQILSKIHAKIYFNDEPKCHFIGSKSSVGAVPEGVNTVIGSFTLFCAKPYKYGGADLYDPETPVNYGEVGDNDWYPNTTTMNWIYIRSYCGIYNYSHLPSPVSMTISGKFTNGKITHMESGKVLTLPNLNSGTIIIDGVNAVISVNGSETFGSNYNFFDFVSGKNSLLFEADNPSAVVTFDWLHRLL